MANSIARKRLHTLLDQIADNQLTNVEKALKHTLEYNIALPFCQGLPVYEMGNKEHTKRLRQLANREK